MNIEPELNELKRMIQDVSNQMQELREAIRGTPIPAPLLPVPQPYQHPWWKYQRSGSFPGRNYLGGQVQATTNNIDTTGSGVSGTT